MTDIREQRIAVLAAAAAAKSEAKTKAADQGIRALVKRGEPVNFQSVQREAGVSHAFLYGNPEIRGRIEHLRAQARRPVSTEPSDQDSESTIVLTLTTQINHLKKQHRHEVQTLRTALEEAHGENLDLRRELSRRGQSHSRLTPPPPTTLHQSQERADLREHT